MSEVRLAASEHASIFREGVSAPALHVTTASLAPHAVLLGGQPGCGKSTLARSSSSWFGSDNFIHVDVDRLRDLHPAYLPMVSNAATETAAPSAVQCDCSLWADMLRDSAIGGQRNILLENTMRSPDQVRESSLAIRKAGYSIEVRIMAVHAKSSEVSLLQRYEHEKRLLGYGRVMPLEYHNLAAAGIVDTVRAIEDEKLVDRLFIFDRQGRTVYENELVNGRWTREADGARTMEQFREASYDNLEKNKIATLWDDVIDMMNHRGAAADVVGTVDVRREAARTIAAHAATCDVDLLAPPVLTVDHGEYVGKIVERPGAPHVVAQKIGRDSDKIAWHECASLSRVPEIGEVVSIKYRNGVGQVSERALEIRKSR